MAEVVIPTPQRHSPAKLAIEMEGIHAREYPCSRPLHYGKHFARLWDRGEPFVIVEWDIVPWPGAVQALIDCPEPWCTHRYPLHRGNVCLSFGVGKYIPTGPAPVHWAETPWQALDGQVVPHLNKLFGSSHVHEPPCAHCRREVAE